MIVTGTKIHGDANENLQSPNASWELGDLPLMGKEVTWIFPSPILSPPSSTCALSCISARAGPTPPPNHLFDTFSFLARAA